MAEIRRLFVLDSGLAHLRGHHLHFAEGVARDAAARGIETHFFVASSAEIDGLPDHPFHKVFRNYLYSGMSSDPYDGALQDFHQGSNAFRDDLAPLLRFRPGREDLILQPSASFRTLAGFAKFRIASACPSPAAFLFHHLLPKDLGTTPGTLGGAIARMTGRMVGSLRARGRHMVGSTTSVLADKLAAAMDIPVPVLPLPHWYEPDDATPDRIFRQSDPGVATIAFIGALRSEKGGNRMTEIARAAEGVGIGARMVVQYSDPEPALVPPLRALHEAGRIELIERELTDGELARLVTDATLLLMPYDREPYAERISGLFCLASACGTPCIVPDGTWMAEQILAGRAAGSIYSGDSIAAIVAGMGRAVGDATTLRKDAATRTHHWTARESGSALLDGLIRWAEA
ncbi:MAG: glycosyltransferase [Rhodospirillaceae bacterium]|nr:glycosyltransferase [Rhodospirillaceae bacterium]